MSEQSNETKLRLKAGHRNSVLKVKDCYLYCYPIWTNRPGHNEIGTIVGDHLYIKTLFFFGTRKNIPVIFDFLYANGIRKIVPFLVDDKSIIIGKVYRERITNGWTNFLEKQHKIDLEFMLKSWEDVLRRKSKPEARMAKHK